MSWKLTVRHGPRVERESFDDLDQALAEITRRAETIRAEGPAKPVKMLREFEPEVQVKARLELSGPRSALGLRGREAGLDVMGDGAVVPYTGAIFKRRIEVEAGDPFQALRDALEGDR